MSWIGSGESEVTMKILDISVPAYTGMVVWPGDGGVVIERESKIEAGDNANVSHLSLGAHTGTHVDAPYHFIPDGVTLEQVSLDRFVGKALVVEISGVSIITAAHLAAADLPDGVERVLFKTDNGAIWSRTEAAFEPEFVALSPDAAQFLVDREVKFVGIDYLSIAPFNESRPVHEILLSAEVAILEGVDLRAVAPGWYTLYCLPLNLVGVDGAPARAILVEEG
jgi:arylformamidase